MPSTDKVLVVVRLIFHIGGMFLTTIGWMAQSKVDYWAEVTAQVVGPIMQVIGLVWTAWSQRDAAKIASVAKLPEVTQITVTDPAIAEKAAAVAPETKIVVAP